ncbi:hypothetical protein BASA81_002162 [Batrachochytrium salamandrivorans]|nr:hypothetical protein BASA81_002162 [Batrachochytrium salamandrivorans]
MAEQESCFKDLVFRVTANASLEPCAEPHAAIVVSVLYSFTAFVLGAMLVQSLLGACLTTNPKARSTMLWFAFPSALGVANLVLVATRGTETGESGYAIIVLFGVCTVCMMFVSQLIGLASMDLLAKISLKAVDAKTRARFTPKPLVLKLLIALKLSSYVWYALVFVCLCVMFPLSETQANAQYGRRFWWDLGITTTQFLGMTNLMMFLGASMYVTVQNLQTCLSNISDVMGLNPSDHVKKYVSDLSSMIFKIRTVMLCLPVLVVFNWALTFCMTYASGIEPRYYLLWIYLTVYLLGCQLYVNIFFCPDQLLARLRGTYDPKSSLMEGMNSSKLDLKSSKQQMASIASPRNSTEGQQFESVSPKVADL